MDQEMIMHCMLKPMARHYYSHFKSRKLRLREVEEIGCTPSKRWRQSGSRTFYPSLGIFLFSLIHFGGKNRSGKNLNITVNKDLSLF